MKTHFKTLEHKTEYLLKDKGSKFIAVAQMCFSEADIKEKLTELKLEHPQATHICYAWKLGVNREQTRANDDGEPNNSAGTPILGQINSFELTNTFVAVIRYYGGIKLGVGGLISAYKGAAKAAIELNEIVTKELSTFLELKVDYNEFPMLMKFIKQNKITLLRQEQSNDVFLELEIRNSILDAVKEALGTFKNIEFIKEIKSI